MTSFTYVQYTPQVEETQQTQPSGDISGNFLFAVPEAWQDIHNIGVEPPSIWDGTGYSLDTATDPTSGISHEGILSLAASNYPTYVAAGSVLFGHVEWTTEAGGEFTISFTGGTNGPLTVVDEVLGTGSGGFDFSYTFDGTEFPDPLVDPNGYTSIDVELAGGVNGEGTGTNATAALTPFAPLPPPPALVLPPSRKLELCYSKDGGETFSPWRLADLGQQGNFNGRALFRRLGIARRMVLRIRYSGDSCRDVVQASVDTSPFP